jgi:hypothetical protein
VYARVNVEFRRIPYDVQKVATAIRQSEWPDNFATDIEPGGAPARTLAT